MSYYGGHSPPPTQYSPSLQRCRRSSLSPLPAPDIIPPSERDGASTVSHGRTLAGRCGHIFLLLLPDELLGELLVVLADDDPQDAVSVAFTCRQLFAQAHMNVSCFSVGRLIPVAPFHH